MGIVEEYEKRVKKPIIEVTITRFFEGENPSVEGGGQDYVVSQVLACDISAGFDQASSTCSLTILAPLEDGEVVRFQPMNRVVVKQSWNQFFAEGSVSFRGFIDTIEYSNPPMEIKIECRDILKLAQDNYYISSNRRVYSATVSEEYFETTPPFAAMGGQDIEDRQVQVILTDLLTDSGIPSGYLQLTFDEYPATGAIIIGNNATAVFEYESSMDAVTRVTELIGYRLWADKSGYVRAREVLNIAGATYAQTYQSQEETYDGAGLWTITKEGNLLAISTSKDDDLRNWIEVIGYEGISSTVAGLSDYVPSPPTYRRTEIKSDLLDTDALAVAAASKIFTDLNRLRYKARVSIEGDPRIELGQTIRLYDKHALTAYSNYLLYDFSSTFRPEQWTMDLNLIGGEGEGAPAIGNIAPIAMFTSSIEQDYLENDTYIYEIYVNASSSYDPDGARENLLYNWVASGFPTTSGIDNVYTVSVTGTFLVTLTVTDQGTPTISYIFVQYISHPASTAKWKTIFMAVDQYIYSTINGGEVWLQKELY